MIEEIKQFISQAIDDENRSKEMYLKLMENTKSESLKSLFQELAAQEEDHANKLSKLDPNFIKFEKLFDDNFGKINRDVEHSKIIANNEQNVVELRQQLFFAIRKEEADHQKYIRVAQLMGYDSIFKKLFTLLADEELAHKMKLAKAVESLF
ncbi:ferritin family protein [Nanoarchaeota archaeon]